MSSLRTLLRDARELIGKDDKSRWILVVLVAVLASAAEAMGAVMIYVLLRIVNDPTTGLDVPVVGNLKEQFPDTAQNTLIGVVIAAIGVFFLLRAAVAILQARLQNRTANETGAELSRRLLIGYLQLPWSFHLVRNSSESIRNATTSVTEVVTCVLLPIVMLLAEGLVVAAMVTVMLVIAPLATLSAVLLLAPLVFLLLRLVQPRLLRAGQGTQAAHKDSLQAIQQTLGGLREIKVLGREEWFEQEFTDIRKQMARALVSRAILAEVPRIAIETTLLLLIVLFLGTTILTGGAAQDSITVLGLFAYAALRVMPGLNRAVSQINTLRYGGPALSAVVEDLRIVEAIESKRQSVDPLPFERTVALEGVSFRYAGADQDALSDIDLAIRRGESIGVIGPTGSGKSTLVDVLLGLLTPTAGRVAVDGRDIAQAPAAWQRNLGVVPQSVFLIDDTVRRNVALGVADADIDEAALAEALSLAQLDEVIAGLPDGLDTRLGEMGIRLSGGQRQRVAIARALYIRPSVLLFDEGTSALDSETEAEFVEALTRLRGERTILTVAHRLSTVAACDRVVLVRAGRIADIGTLADITARNDTPRLLTGS
jgi:ATP-binding cassette subfamily C protein